MALTKTMFIRLICYYSQVNDSYLYIAIEISPMDFHCGRNFSVIISYNSPTLTSISLPGARSNVIGDSVKWLPCDPLVSCMYNKLYSHGCYQGLYLVVDCV